MMKILHTSEGHQSHYSLSDWATGIFRAKQPIFKFLKFYLATSGLSCGTQDLHRVTCGLFPCSAETLVLAHRLWSESSVVTVWGLSCSESGGISVLRPGIKPLSPALWGGFLTTREAPQLTNLLQSRRFLQDKQKVQKELQRTSWSFSTHTHKDHYAEMSLLNYRGVTWSRCWISFLSWDCIDATCCWLRALSQAWYVNL